MKESIMLQNPTCEEIARRAYEIYLSRGAQDGHDLDDWLQAEIQLKKEFGSAAMARESRTVPQSVVTAATESLKSVTPPRAAAGKGRLSAGRRTTGVKAAR
jgi:hypothetical protein